MPCSTGKSKTHRTVELRCSILIAIILLAACSSDQKPAYLDQIPGFDRFDYKPVQEESLNERRITVYPSLWGPDSANAEYFTGTPFWIETVDDEIWIADPTRGIVTAFTKEGEYYGTVAEKGDGPGEVQQPASIHHIKTADKNFSWILDSGLRSLIHYSTAGTELKRVHQKQMLIEFYNNRVTSLPGNLLLFPIMNHEQHVLAAVDFSGEMMGTFVNRIVPAGFQPVTHNRVFFDSDKDTGRLIYAHHGLPLIFLKDPDGSDRRVYNFKPGTALEDFNTGLTPRPANERVSVNSVTRDLFLDNNRVMFRIFNDVVIFDLETEQVDSVLQLMNGENEPLIIQQMFFSGGTLYFVNRFTNEIYILNDF